MRYAYERSKLARPDRGAEPRLQRTRAGLIEQVQEARDRGWLGEVERLAHILVGFDDKLAEIDRSERQATIVQLGPTNIRPSSGSQGICVESRMAGHRSRRSPAQGRQPKGTPPLAPTPTDADPVIGTAREKIQRVLDTPLAELVATEEERAVAEELTRQAAAAPAMARLREVVAFVGKGRSATQAGNLKAADAAALAGRLAIRDDVSVEVRSMSDVPEAAYAFRWAAAAEFLASRGTKIVAGPRARDLGRDPLAAWLNAAITLLEHGLLDGFRQGWRKSYVGLLDGDVADLLATIAQAGGAVPLATIEDRSWEQVAGSYGYEPDDDAERQHVVQLVSAMMTQLADIGIVTRRHDDVVLTVLGSTLAVAAAMSADDDLGDLDLVDTDAQSLLLVCVEDMEPAEARAHLLAWCQARPADEAADEVCDAMLDDEDPDVWRLGLEALAMIDPAVAEPAVRRLQSHSGLRPLATKWLRRHGRPPSPRTPR
jgi:hypothetical protein